MYIGGLLEKNAWRLLGGLVGGLWGASRLQKAFGDAPGASTALFVQIVFQRITPIVAHGYGSKLLPQWR